MSKTTKAVALKNAINQAYADLQNAQREMRGFPQRDTAHIIKGIECVQAMLRRLNDDLYNTESDIAE